MRPRRPWPVRLRLTVVVTSLTALALVVVGVALVLYGRHHVEVSASQASDQVASELRATRAAGDPATGRAWQDDDALVAAFLSRFEPDAHQGVLAVPASGTPRGKGTTADLQHDAGLVAAARSTGVSGRTVSIHTGGRDLRVAIVPVGTGANHGGAVLVVQDVAPAYHQLGGLLATYGVLAALVLLLTGSLAWLATGRLLAPLRRLSDTAESIDEHELDRRVPASGRDELAGLERTVNAMLARLEDAFTTQRELLDDVGHELRTPLTVLRGHLELVDVDDPADVAATRSLLLDEVDRMGRLVGDLLLLAQSRRPDFVRRRPCDLGELTTSILAKARALDVRDWRLELPDRPATVMVDDQRLTQAVLQLADNAVHHTTDRDEIRIGSAVRGGRVDLWVADSGPGIAPCERASVLQRFSRGADAVPHDGFGLGLSIVDAIARAHGGDVTVDDSQLGGATVRLTMPMVPAGGPR